MFNLLKQTHCVAQFNLYHAMELVWFWHLKMCTHTHVCTIHICNIGSICLHIEEKITMTTLMLSIWRWNANALKTLSNVFWNRGWTLLLLSFKYFVKSSIIFLHALSPTPPSTISLFFPLIDLFPTSIPQFLAL